MQLPNSLIIKPIAIKTGCMNIVFDQLKKSSKQLTEYLDLQNNAIEDNQNDNSQVPNN